MGDGLSVLVVGGGIGGLALAGALARDGAEVTLLEKATQWRPVGAGIVLGANAVAVLGALGAGARVAELGRPLASMSVLNVHGDVLQRMDMAALSAQIGPTYTFHRADLHQLLLEGTAGVDLRMGETVDAVKDGPDGVNVRLSGGEERRYDLVIGADGLHSRVRALAFADSGAEVRYAGYTCWRFVMHDPAEREGAVEMWGAGLRVGLVPLRGGRLYGFLTENAPPRGLDPEQGRHAWVAAKYAAFGGPARPVMEALAARPEVTLMRHDIEDLSTQVWRGQRVALLGDAGHATTPNLGQGAGMALEDALALVRCLRCSADPGAALAAYEKLRATRVAGVVRTSRQLGAMAQWSHPLAVALTNFAARCVPDAISQRSLAALVAPGLDLARQ